MGDVTTENLVSVTVDIEDWYHTPSITGSTFSRYKSVDDFFNEWKGRNYDRLTDPTNKILKILDEFNIKATFFIVADVVEHYPGLVESIADKGHEIACHGLHHCCKTDHKTKEPLMSREEFIRRTKLAKSILESATGKKVYGYRAPNCYLSGWMIDSLEEIGFKYDSSVSVNSLYNKTDSSLKGVGTQAYYPELNELISSEAKRGIIEYPWPYINAFGFKFPSAGGPMLRFFGSKYIKTGLNQSLKAGDTLFYFHPIDMAEEKFPEYFSINRPFYWAIKGNIVEKRIRDLLDFYKDRTIELYKKEFDDNVRGLACT